MIGSFQLLFQRFLYYSLKWLVDLFIESIEGFDNIPSEGPFIVVANQNNAIDGIFLLFIIAKKRKILPPAVIRYQMPRNMHFAQRMIFIISRMLYEKAVGSIPADNSTVDKAINILAENIPVIIFPEGVHNSGEVLKMGKTGAAQMSLKSQAPIVPVGIIGSERIFPDGSYAPRREKVKILIGETMYPDQYMTDCINGHFTFTHDIMLGISTLCGKPYPYKLRCSRSGISVKKTRI